jgi:uncharacterized membrane protein
MISAIRDRPLLALIFLLFGAVFCLSSFANHYFFRTYALDLGLYNNAIFDYAHFRLNHYSLQREAFPTPFADHFELLPMLASPLYWVFGTYALLVLQVAAVLFGGYGIYSYFHARAEVRFLPEIAVIHFFCIWAIYSALSFDFHNNVVAAMLVPWFIHYFEGERKRYWLLFGLILISKENMALWAAFICLGLAAGFRKDKAKRNAALLMSAIALIYFLVIIRYVIVPLGYPQNVTAGYYHFKYSALGSNVGDALRTLSLHPLYALRLLFLNHTPEPAYDGIKAELHTMFVLSGGLAVFLRPRYLVMLLPVFAQKLLSDDPSKWGICYQYSIEFAPVLTLALFGTLIRWKSASVVFSCSILVTLVTIASTVYSFDNRRSVWYDPVATKFYSAAHYRAPFDVPELNATLARIPAEAKVSSSSPLVPHLAFRKVIYQFPIVEDADYIVLLNAGNRYPLDANGFAKEVADLKSSSDWQLIYDENLTIIFKAMKAPSFIGR